MNPDRWQQISQVYHAALTRDARDRAGFLREACAGDEALQQEVASLLANERQAAGFLSDPAFAAAAGARPTKQAYPAAAYSRGRRLTSSCSAESISPSAQPTVSNSSTEKPINAACAATSVARSTWPRSTLQRYAERRLASSACTQST